MTCTRRVLARAARLFRALADPSRLQALDALRGGEASVAEVAGRSVAPAAAAASRLRVLHAANLVHRRRENGRHIYRLPACHVEAMMDAAFTRGTSTRRPAGA
jgi:DNA-binding transcriptional ArsR family regulator